MNSSPGGPQLCRGDGDDRGAVAGGRVFAQASRIGWKVDVLVRKTSLQ